ncbi:hypothetical protein CA830_25080, partial [Burkholderia multivorans]
MVQLHYPRRAPPERARRARPPRATAFAKKPVPDPKNAFRARRGAYGPPPRRVGAAGEERQLLSIHSPARASHVASAGGLTSV